MKIILLCWESNSEEILYAKAKSMGNEIIPFKEKCTHYTRDLEYAQKLIMLIHQKKADAILSFDFFPIASMVCQTVGIPYYSWVYDCPHLTLYSKQAKASCNRIAIFDKELCAKLLSRGVEGAFHLPLPVDCDWFGKTLKNAGLREVDKFGGKISFVGSLYNDSKNYFEILPVDKKTREKSYEMLKDSEFSYRNISLHNIEWEESLKEDWYEVLAKENLLLDEDYDSFPEDIFQDSIMGRMLTHMERRDLLCRIAKRYGTDFSLFTNSDLAKYPELASCNKGPVDYEKQMPLVFSESKINLNISLRSITTGIPLRVLDIMACGGFVLTNYQAEIEELFEVGREIAVFDDVEDCLEKIEYYLEHEEERKAVAMAGKKAVEERFSYEKLLPVLLEKCK